LLPGIEEPNPIRAGYHAIPATNTLVLIDKDYPILLPLCDCPDRAGGHAGSSATVEAVERDAGALRGVHDAQRVVDLRVRFQAGDLAGGIWGVALDVVGWIGGQFGNFELNTMMPVIAANLFESIELLTNGSIMLAEKCVKGIQANRDRCRELLDKSLMLVTNLSPVIGYDKAAKLAKKAYKENKTIREVLKADRLIPEDQVDKLLDPKTMLSPK